MAPRKNQPRKNIRMISHVRSSRRVLRKLGLTSAEMCVLDELALKLWSGTIRTLRGAHLARCMGVSRQWVNTILRRLADLGLILRWKTGLIRLNVEMLSKINRTRAKKSRRKPTKWLKNLIKSRCGNNGFPLKERELRKEEKAMRYDDRQTSLRDLKAMYVPVHLRQGA